MALVRKTRCGFAPGRILSARLESESEPMKEGGLSSRDAALNLAAPRKPRFELCLQMNMNTKLIVPSFKSAEGNFIKFASYDTKGQNSESRVLAGRKEFPLSLQDFAVAKLPVFAGVVKRDLPVLVCFERVYQAALEWSRVDVQAYGALIELREVQDPMNGF